MVECFLTDNQEPLHNIPGTMVWYFPGGMVNYPGTLAADPLQNLNPSAWKPFHLPVVDGPTAAWPIYIGHVALNLASEIYGWVP